MKRLPTIEEFKELITKCKWTWDSLKKGYIVKGPNGNSIFLPAAGFQDDSGGLYSAGSIGLYWSSSFRTYGFAYYLSFNSGIVNWTYTSQCNGHSVRFVSDTEGIDLGLSVKWDNKNVGAVSGFGYGNYFTYDEAIKLNNMERPEIKAGMLIEAKSVKYLVIPTSYGKLVGITSDVAWHSDIQNAENITKIGWPIGYNNSRKFEFGEVLWEKPKEVILSMQEIADKFGIPVDQLKIKK